MTERLAIFVESHPWAAPFVAVLNWIIATLAWSFKHPDDLTKFFALASSVVGLGAVWYTMRIKRRQFLQPERRRR